MAGIAHDVSRELRGYHGRWTRGDAMQRVREAQASEYRQTTIHPHDEVKRQLEAIPMNGGKRINGVPTGRSRKGYYVAFPKAGGGRDSKSYKSSGHAARAVIEGRHHDENDPHEPETPGGGGGFKETPRPSARPEPRPERPAARPAGKPRLADEEVFRRSLPQSGGPYAGTAPDISARGTMHAGELKAARVDTMSAKSMTARYNGDLNAPVVLAARPHGHGTKRGSTTFGAWGASRTSGYRTQLELHKSMWTSPGAQANYEYQKSSGWWVPTDKSVNMGQAVATHEYGHGVHDEMHKGGHITQVRSRSDANIPVTNPDEQEFWRQYAEAVGVSPPQESGNEMNVYSWMQRNRQAISTAVSKYGSGNTTEMLAELWCEYCNNSNARPPAVVYGNYVRSTIGDKKAIAA